MTRLPAVSILLFLAAGAAAQEQAPKVLVDDGACPFECCRYGRWTTTEDVRAFDSPGAERATHEIPAGTVVTAVTGHVRTVGTPFVVNRAHPPYEPGDTLMVYTYHGEGIFSVWHEGKRFTEDLGFSPYGGTLGEWCTVQAHCWGTLSQALQFDWWIQLRLGDGKTVWVHGAEGFEGQDACG